MVCRMGGREGRSVAGEVVGYGTIEKKTKKRIFASGFGLVPRYEKRVQNYDLRFCGNRLWTPPHSTFLGVGGVYAHTVRLTSIYNQVSENQNFCFTPTETIDGQVKK